MIEYVKIYETAEIIRKDFESNNIPKNVLCDLYSRYNPEVDAKKFVDSAIEMFPKLNCGLASLYLQKKLGQGEIVRGKHLEHNHTFLQLDNGEIVDITADQYGGPEVYIGELKLPWCDSVI